ncbi:MAG TPA: hypothetical protein VGY58_03425, partial [Gemmataceae bacterium]|nr:hypothetical protein [Gemmataceae bacterium]
MGVAKVFEPELMRMVPRTILKRLAQLRRRERLLGVLWGTARGVAVAAVVLGLACLLDWLIDRRQDTPLALRWTMLLVQSVMWGTLLIGFLCRPLLRRMSDSHLSLYVEDKTPALGQRLISAVQLNRRGARVEGMSPDLIAAMTREAEAQTAGIDFRRLADHRRLRWSAVTAAPIALAIGIALLCWPATIEALLARQFLADREIPRSVHLESVSRELVWPAGEDVELRFYATGPSLSGQVLGQVRINPDGQASERYPMVLEEISSTGTATYVARVPSAITDFTYLAWLGDGRTRQPSRVHFEARPAVVEQRAWVLLPRYYGLRPNGERYEQEQPRGDIVAVPNASVRIAITTQKPLVHATLELLGSASTPSVAPAPEVVLRTLELKLGEGGDTAACTFDPRPQETAYRILVRDRFDFENIAPPRRSLRVLPEESPQVALLPERFPASGDDGPAEDFEVEGVPVPLGGSIRIAYTCTAPSGLSHAQLRFRVNEGSWRPLPLTEMTASEQTGPFDPRQGAFEKSSALDQVEFHALSSSDPERQPGRRRGGGRFDFQTRRIPELKVGDKIEFYVEVFDRNPDPERAPGRSEARIKSVVTPAELESWVRQTLQEESRIRKLEGNQRGVFAMGGSGEGDAAAERSPADDSPPPPRLPGQAASTFVHA